MPFAGFKYINVNKEIIKGYDLQSIQLSCDKYTLLDPFPERVDQYHNHWQYKLKHLHFEDFPILTF